MYFLVYDAEDRLRAQGESWPLIRSALDVVISEGSKGGVYPVLLIGPGPADRREGKRVISNGE